MEQSVTAESHFVNYIKNIDVQYADEKAVLADICRTLSVKKSPSGNKDVIISLLEKLETERDIIKLDIYRQALEIVVHHTPDDIR